MKRSIAFVSKDPPSQLSPHSCSLAISDRLQIDLNPLRIINVKQKA